MPKMNLKKETLVFIVDDDENCLEILSRVLLAKNDNPVRVKVFTTGEACLNSIVENPDIVILDYYLNSKFEGGPTGKFFLNRILNLKLDIKVILLSSQKSVDKAIEVLRMGAYDYVYKNESAYLRVNKLVQKIASVKSSYDYPQKLNINKNAHVFVFVIFLILFILSRFIS